MDDVREMSLVEFAKEYLKREKEVLKIRESKYPDPDFPPGTFPEEDNYHECMIAATKSTIKMVEDYLKLKGE